MATVVNIPNVGRVRFPDELSQEDVQREAGKLYSNTQPRAVMGELRAGESEESQIESPAAASARLNLPVVTGEDGSRMTVKSIGVGDERGEWVIPTIVGGKEVSQDEAVSLWRAGKNKPLNNIAFKTSDEATSWAKDFHTAEEERTAPITMSLPATAPVPEKGAKKTDAAVSSQLDATIPARSGEELAAKRFYAQQQNDLLPREGAPAAIDILDLINTPILEATPTGGRFLGYATEDPAKVAEVKRIRKSGLPEEKIALGVREAADEFLSGLTSPLALATFGAAGALRAAPVLSRALSAWFAFHMGKGLAVDTAQALGTEYGKPEEQRDQAKLTKLWTSAALSAPLTAAVGLHALKGEPASTRAPGEKPPGPTREEYLSKMGLEPDATAADIKSAFRDLAKKYHPDVAGNNPEATAKFQEILEAYTALTPPKPAQSTPEPPKPADVKVAEESNLPVTAEVLKDLSGKPSEPAPKIEPETGEALTKQLDLTVDPASTKAATLVTPGSPQMIVPEGMESVVTKHGEVIFNPAKTTREAVLKAAEGKDFDGTLLGMSQSAKPEPVGNTVVQTTKDGVPVLDEVVAPTPEAIAKATEAHKTAVPGGETTVRPAEEVLEERKKGDKSAPDATTTVPNPAKAPLRDAVAPEVVAPVTPGRSDVAVSETDRAGDSIPVLKSGIETPGEAAQLDKKLGGGGVRIGKDGKYEVIGRVDQPKPKSKSDYSLYGTEFTPEQLDDMATLNEQEQIAKYGTSRTRLIEAETMRRMAEKNKPTQAEGKKGFQPEDAKLDKRKPDAIRADMAKREARIQEIEEKGLPPNDMAIALADGDAAKAAEFSKELLRNQNDFDRQLLEAKEKAAKPNPPKRGEVGGMLAAGEVVLTSSGRETTPFPKVDLTSNRKTGNTLKRVDEWLQQNAIAEAEARGDEFNALQFRAEKLGNIPPASKDSMEHYLFGEQPPVLKSPLKPLAPVDKTEAPAQPARDDSAAQQPRESASGLDVREPAGTGPTTQPEQGTTPAPGSDEPASPATSGPVEAKPGDERGRGVRSGDSGTAGPERRPSDKREPAGTDAVSGTGKNPPAPRSVADRNHVLPNDQDFIPTGDKAKVRANLDAIALLKKLEAENRNPTPEEKTILAKYVGWGGLKEVFDEGKAAYRERPPWNEDQRKEFANWEKQWGKLYDEVGEVLSPDEHRTAARSILNAHYTSREVVNGVWQAVARLGFTGGKALEPSAGVGNFMGLTPEAVRAKTKWTAVELDAVSGRILAKLYPEARTHQMGFQDAKIAPNSQDLVITNVPFDAEGPNDKRYPAISLHNYFIARALDVVKPGGIVAVITSDSTMDNSGAGRKAREYFAEKGDLVGALRLPNTAFKKNAGTEVTTDLLFFRKHDGTPFSGEPFKSVVPAETYKHEPIQINEYFAAHPEMMLGRMSLEGTMYRKDQQALIPTPGADLNKQLATAIAHLPENVIARTGGTSAPEGKLELAAQGTKIGALTLRDGVPMVAEPDGSLSTPEWAGSPAKVTQARKYIAVREATRKAIDRMFDPNSTEADIADDRKVLNTEYDAYVKKYGAINERSSSFLDDDVDFPLTLALEDANTKMVESEGKTKRITTWTKSKMFTDRTIFPRVAPEHVDTVDDAVQVSQNFLGKVDPEYIGRLTGRPMESVAKELEDTGQAFENPKTGQWENRSTFLSGFVKQKLTAARHAAESDPRFQRHVQELEKVQPPPLAIENMITTDPVTGELKGGVRLGSTWVPPGVIEKFISNTLQVNARVSYTPQTGNWHVLATGGQQGELNKTKYGIHDWKGHELVESALNLKSPTVTELVPADGGGTKEQKNPTKSLEAAEKQNQLQREFKKFVLSDPETGRALEKIYNDDFNGVVAPKFEPPTWAHYPGASSDITLREHQKAVVTRMIQNSTLLAHAVGTGKTYAMVTAAMEMRRLGLARKPMIVVQNATLEQFARSFKRLYPTARILAPNAKMRDAKNRNKTMARIATGEWDAVIIPQSFVNMLPDNPEREAKYINDRLDELKAAHIEAAHEGGKRSPKASDLQKAIKRLEERLEALVDRKKDNVLSFEQLGVDALFVDEAHAYKKLEFSTQMDNIKGLDKSYSQRGFSMFMKTRWVQEKNQGRNVIFATGTPVSNTIAEAWTMMRYVRPDVLKHYGIENFDSFASTFGDTQTKVEMTAGGTWKPVTRFARFTNGPELVAAWRTVADVVTPEEINLPGLPSLKNGKPTVHVIKQTPALTKYIAYIRSELDRFAAMSGKQKRDNSHIPLVMFTLAKKASLDMRMIDPTLPDEPGSKLNVAADEVARAYKESTPVKGTQMVFSDSFQDNPDAPRFNLYNDLKSKLIERGIPAEEIAIITADIKDVKKDALFQKVSAGEVRVLIGSTERMGVGVNVQEKLISLHHLDAPPRPMDIEQRNGRIIRQNNENPVVEVHSYGVENSLDAAMFDKLATKQKFTNQILRGDLQGRNFDDSANEVSLSFEEMMAAFSGDPRAMQKVGLENQVRQVEMLRSGHVEQIRKSRETVEQLTQRTIPYQEKNLAETTARAATFDKAFAADKDYALTVGNRTVTGRKDVAEAMDHVLKQGIETTVKNAKSELHFGNFAVELSPVTLNGQKILLSGKAMGDAKGIVDAERVNVSWKFEDGGNGGNTTTGVGFLHSLAATLERISAEPKHAAASLASEQRNLRELEGFVKQPFEREAELATARETLAKLEAELKAEGAAKPPPPVQQPSEEEAGEADDEGTAGATTAPPIAPAPSAPTLTPKSQRQIITDLAKGLNVPIRFGRLRTNKLAGYFRSVQNLIGAKRANDLPVVSHEVGHKLDDTFNFSSVPAVATELMTLGNPATPGSISSWTPSKSKAYQLAEGTAEFVRYWLTDPAHAAAVAPMMNTAFEAALNANKDVGDVMRTAQNDIDTWRKADPQARLRSHISIGSNPNKTPYTLSQLTRDVVDDLHFMRLATEDAIKAQPDLPPSQQPYLLARLLRGSYGMADSFVRTGVADFATKEVTLGTSLEDALKPVAGRLNDFRDWIVAKQAKEMHAQGKETGLLDADVNFTAARFDGDTAFQEAFTKVKEWNDALLQYVVDAGMVDRGTPRIPATATTPEIAPTGSYLIREMNQDFVPFHRVFEVGAGEAPSVEGGGNGRGLNVGKPSSLQRRTGSARDIVDPLETMIRNAYTLITAAEKTAINTAVANMAHLPNMGKWVEHIKTPQKAVTFGLEKVREQLEAAGADLTAVPDELALQFFQDSRQAPFGENVIKVVRDGKPEFYRLNKDLFETFHALNVDDAGKLVKILSFPAQLFRAGVTLAPDFALANAMRDAFSSSILSRYGLLPFEAVFRGMQALATDPEIVAQWMAAGGRNSIEATYFDRDKLQRYIRERISKDLTPAERAMIWTGSPLQAMRWLSGISEEATRVGEFKNAYEKLIASGMPPAEARRLAAFESRDRQDFAMGGARLKLLRRLTPFFNAALQGNYRLLNALKDPATRNRAILYGLMFLMLPKLLEQLLNWSDPDYWDRPQWERDQFLLVPVGKDAGHTKFMRVPQPYGIGTIFGTLPGRIAQSVKEKSGGAMVKFPWLVAKEFTPNPLPPYVTTMYETALNGKQGYDVFRDRPIVPDSLAVLPPEHQWTEQTSLTAKKIGSALGYSPMKVDHIISQTLGSVAKQATHQVIDRVISMATGEERTARGTVPGGRFVTTPATVSSQAIEDFYKTLDQMKGAKAAQKKFGEANDLAGWPSRFAGTEKRIAAMRKRMHNAKTEEAKNAAAEDILRTARTIMAQFKASQGDKQRKAAP